MASVAVFSYRGKGKQYANALWQLPTGLMMSRCLTLCNSIHHLTYAQQPIVAEIHLPSIGTVLCLKHLY